MASIYSANQRQRKEKLVNAYLVSMCKDKPHQGILIYHSVFPGVFRVAFRQGLANAHAISIIQTIILFTIPSMPVRTCPAGYLLTIMRHKWIKTKTNKNKPKKQTKTNNNNAHLIWQYKTVAYFREKFFFFFFFLVAVVVVLVYWFVKQW